MKTQQGYVGKIKKNLKKLIRIITINRDPNVKTLNTVKPRTFDVNKVRKILSLL